MNITLYKRGLKGSWKLFVVFAAVLTMYFSIIITMFDPELGSALVEFEKLMPELMAMVGMTQTGTTLAGFMASYLYGFIMLVFPMVFSIFTANNLVVRQVDQGYMAYLLAAPVPRGKIVFTQIKVLLTGLVLLVGYAALVGIAASEWLFPGELDIPLFLLLNLGALALQCFIAGICFFFSCLFNDTKYSIALGAGIPALAFIIQMMANAGEEMANMKYATFFTLFAPQQIVAQETWPLWGMGALAAGALLLFIFSARVFIKKDIPV